MTKASRDIRFDRMAPPFPRILSRGDAAGIRVKGSSGAAFLPLLPSLTGFFAASSGAPHEGEGATAPSCGRTFWSREEASSGALHEEGTAALHACWRMEMPNLTQLSIDCMKGRPPPFMPVVRRGR